MGIYIEKIIWKDLTYYAVYSTFVDKFVSKMYSDSQVLINSEKNDDGSLLFGQKDLENLEINYNYSTEFLKNVENESAFTNPSEKEQLKSLINFLYQMHGYYDGGESEDILKELNLDWEQLSLSLEYYFMSTTPKKSDEEIVKKLFKLILAKPLQII